MTYANYGGWNYMGIDRPALVRAFKDLRRQNFAARLGLSQNEGNTMRRAEPNGTLVRINQHGAAWTLASDENQTWYEGSGLWNAEYGSYTPLAIQCSGSNGGSRWTAQQVAGYVCRVLEIHGLHPCVDLDALVEPVQCIIIKLYPSTRLHAMTDDDREAQRNREARHNEIEAQAEAEADAREARQHERRIQGYIDRYTDALCDQSILRMNSGSGGVEQDVVEFMEERQQTIDSFLAELNGMARRGGSMFTPQELARIVTSGASRADERLRAMRNDVIDGGDHGNARAAELILIPSRMRSTAPVAFPWLT